MSQQDALIIFVRNPEWGKVKTRLARELGNDLALRIYHYLLSKTHATALKVPCLRFLYYSNYVPGADEWSDRDFVRLMQSDGDLGRRMQAAFREVFHMGASRAMIIGSDCPYLDAGHISEGFRLLNSSDFVMGPARDGGYYLLGMREYLPYVFSDIQWSTPEVASDTIRIIRSHGKDYALLPTLPDIDEAEDWDDYLREHPDVVRCLDQAWKNI